VLLTWEGEVKKEKGREKGRKKEKDALSISSKAF